MQEPALSSVRVVPELEHSPTAEYATGRFEDAVALRFIERGSCCVPIVAKLIACDCFMMVNVRVTLVAAAKIPLPACVAEIVQPPTPV